MSDSQAELHAILQFIVAALVERAKDVEIVAINEEPPLTFQIRVSSGDLGKVIGKQGRTARAIRTIIQTHSMKTGQRACIDIVARE